MSSLQRSHLEREWASSFPFPTVRQQQVEAIDFVTEAFDSGVKHAVLQMGVGCGKSAVAVAVARYACASDAAHGAYVITPQRALQEQYVRDFGMATLKSAAAYDCRTIAGSSCAAARKLSATLRAAGCAPACDPRGCAYRAAKDAFVANPLGVTNFAYFVAEISHARELAPRALLVVDECHALESSLVSAAEVSVSSEALARLGVKADLPPESSPVRELSDWMSDVVGRAARAALRLRDGVAAADPERREKLAKQLDGLHRLASKFTRAAEQIDESWVPTWSDGKLLIRPTDVSGVARDLLFSHADRVLLMSATIPSRAALARSLGIEGEAWLSLESPFDPSNRPILALGAADMSAKRIDSELPKLARAVAEIVASHPEWKGLVHTGSYKVQRALRDALSSDPRCIFHDDADREAALALHLSAPTPTVLFSPSMMEGIDLRDDLSRFQIVCKVPYPSLVDPWVARKCEMDPEWYAAATASKLAQALGRSIRHEDDWCVSYVLDRCFSSFRSRHAALLPKSLLAAVTT